MIRNFKFRLGVMKNKEPDTFTPGSLDILFMETITW